MEKRRVLIAILALFLCAVMSVSVLGTDVVQDEPVAVPNEAESDEELIARFTQREDTKGANQRYSSSILQAIRASKFNDESYEVDLDIENIFIIERKRPEYFAGTTDPQQYYVAIPLIGARSQNQNKDIATREFYKGTMRGEGRNTLTIIKHESHFNTQINTLIADNKLENVTETVRTEFDLKRCYIYGYRVVASGNTYYIPYNIEGKYLPEGIGKYNITNASQCALECGKAYVESDFIERINKEETTYQAYVEEQKKIAEEQKTQDFMKIRQGASDNIDVMEDGSSVDINLYGYGYQYELIYRVTTPKNEQKTELTELTNGLFDLIDSLTVDGDKTNIDRMSNVATYQLSLRHKDSSGKWVSHILDVYIKEDAVKIKSILGSVKNTIEVDVKISDSKKVVDFLANAKLTAFTKEYYDPQTPEYLWTIEKGENSYNKIYQSVSREVVEPYVLLDSVDFTFKVPNEIKNPVLEEIANSGETVAGRFENYDPTTKGYEYNYILILSGSKGSVELLKEIQTSLDGSAELYSYNHPIGFVNSYRIENDAVVNYHIGKGGVTNLKLTFADGKIQKVLFDDIVCENAVHKSYSDSSYLTDRYVEKTEEDKETLIKEKKENAIEPVVQDPKRYMTTYKGVRASDGRVFDYTIPYVLEISVNFTASSTPSWYKALGEDVKVILIGMNHTVDGTYYDGRTMVKFEGSKGEQWFNADSAKWDKKDNTASVNNTYNSLISFDGATCIRNTVEFDTISLDAYFEGQDYELTSVVIKIGGKTVEVSADNINYIGGGKATYENIF